jgi:HlyD family secretion protein
MKYGVIIAFILVLVIFSGCTATPESNPIITDTTDYVPIVSVTGQVLPINWVDISVQTSGIVSDLLVTEGEEVEVGDILARINNKDAVNSLEQAEAALHLAETQLEQLMAGPIDKAVVTAETQYFAAQTAISQTIAQRELLDAGGYSIQLTQAKAQVAAAESERFVANQQHDDSMKCQDVQRPDGSTAHICPTLGTIEERLRMALHAADTALTAAETQRDLLYAEHRAQIIIADAAIEAAQAQADVALSQLNLVKAAVPDENIAVAKAVVSQAQVAVDAAHLAIEKTVIHSPMAGILGQVSIREGEFVMPGAPAFIVGDISNLRVETTDLDEIDVAQIALNQSAVVTFEALPDETFTGTVDYIAPMAARGGGGVNYTVYLSLDRMDEKLRWGMTAFVDIETQN